MKNNNNKGFTLIELLAVIIILGVLMMTAIPAVTKYIENSRKDTFWQTAKSYIDAARTPLLNGEYQVKKSNFTGIAAGDDCDLPPAGTKTSSSNVHYYTSIDIKDIDLEKGKGKSSFNRTLGQSAGQGYVLVVNKATIDSTVSPAVTNPKDNIVYYFAGVDSGNNGIGTFTAESNLKRASVKKGNASKTSINKIKTNTTSTTLSTITIDSIEYTLYQHCTAK
ncbi:MAG: prepilin-type N-terminal cleavage/methylation domain-containing protein [Bacilli bacterium]|nr:prepilin-type N-terminal cleavage/methylation domain-containing protein [Bacilli bacterium]